MGFRDRGGEGPQTERKKGARVAQLDGVLERSWVLVQEKELSLGSGAPSPLLLAPSLRVLGFSLLKIGRW